ncbi:MAG: hypothetical protein IT201_02210 [Thermoleophilia bacterium]|nr:hypothetical protein [Thermoleophilia bacterium]
MGEEDIVDPRVVPRWVPAGVSGVPRPRDWDAVVAVDVPELEGDPTAELAFRTLGDGTIVPGGGDGAPLAALERLAAALSAAVRPPYEARAARRGRSGWSAAARRLRSEAVELPGGLAATELAVAIPPDGGRLVLVDGDEPDRLEPPLARAADTLERLGRERYATFVVRAARPPGGDWTIVVDPL